MLRYVDEDVDVIQMFCYKFVVMNFNDINSQYVIFKYDNFIIDA